MSPARQSWKIALGSSMFIHVALLAALGYGTPKRPLRIASEEPGTIVFELVPQAAEKSEPSVEEGSGPALSAEPVANRETSLKNGIEPAVESAVPAPELTVAPPQTIEPLEAPAELVVSNVVAEGSIGVRAEVAPTVSDGNAVKSEMTTAAVSPALETTVNSPSADIHITGHSVDAGSAPTSPVRIPLGEARYRYSPKPGYPLLAKRRREQGTVLLQVDVDRLGNPVSVTVKESSGSSVLDGAAAVAVRRWIFEPAQLGGTNVESEVEIPILFRLN